MVVVFSVGGVADDGTGEDLVVPLGESAESLLVGIFLEREDLVVLVVEILLVLHEMSLVLEVVVDHVGVVVQVIFLLDADVVETVQMGVGQRVLLVAHLDHYFRQRPFPGESP